MHPSSSCPRSGVDCVLCLLFLLLPRAGIAGEASIPPLTRNGFVDRMVGDLSPQEAARLRPLLAGFTERHLPEVVALETRFLPEPLIGDGPAIDPDLESLYLEGMIVQVRLALELDVQIPPLAPDLTGRLAGQVAEIADAIESQVEVWKGTPLTTEERDSLQMSRRRLLDGIGDPLARETLRRQLKLLST